jgi:hypothetical protein
MIKLEEIRINRVQAIAISAIFIVFLSHIFSAKPEIRKYSENISPTICPSEPTGVNSVVYLSAKKRGVATIQKGERKFKTQKTFVLLLVTPSVFSCVQCSTVDAA